MFEIIYWAYTKERIILNGGEGQGGLGKGRKDIMTQTYEWFCVWKRYNRVDVIGIDSMNNFTYRMVLLNMFITVNIICMKLFDEWIW